MDRTLIDISRRHASRQPDKIAFKFEGRTTTYAELERRGNQVANGLEAGGVKRGDHVGYLGKNTDAYFEAWFDAMKIGAIMVPISWRLALPEVRFMIADSDIRTLFVSRESFALASALRDVPNLRVLAIEAIEAVEAAETEPSESGFEDYARWRDARNTEIPAGADTEIGPKDICLQLYTSGTTGRPKGAMLTHESFVQHLGNMQRADVPWNRWKADDVSLLPMPIAHIGGSGWGVYAIFHGATTVIERQFDIESTFDQIAREKITKIFIVPAALQMLVRHPRARTVNYDSFTHVNYGSSPISPTLLRECIDIFKCGFVQMYGMTETIGTIVALPPEDHHPDGTARMAGAGKALPGVEIAIVDESGKHLGPRAVGEILTRSIANMAGYWNLPDVTRATVDAEGWLHTGDAGYLDEDGYLYIADRIKDLIISGAENIYPTEVENAVSEHPDVAEVAVVGVPDERWGEAVKAFVVPRAGKTIDEAELLRWVKERASIAAYKLPKTIEIIAALPRNPTGKVLRKELRAKYWSEEGRNVG